MELPKLLGSLDGKHICIECPQNGGSAFYNYKNLHSLTLLAVCDAKYTFTLVDIGGYGKDNDAALLQISAFGDAFENGKVAIPASRKTGEHEMPQVLVADEIFSFKALANEAIWRKNLSQWEKIYNYRLSRARQTIKMYLVLMQLGGKYLEDLSKLVFTHQRA